MCGTGGIRPHLATEWDENHESVTGKAGDKMSAGQKRPSVTRRRDSPSLLCVHERNIAAVEVTTWWDARCVCVSE